MASGLPYTGVGKPMWHASTDGVALGIGDFVVKTGTSNLAAISSGRVLGFVGYPIGSLPTVAKATDGDTNRITGVVVATAIDPSTTFGGPSYVAASTAAVVFVEDSPDVIFEIQSDAAASVHTAADIGGNVNIISSTPNTSTGRSSAKINSASVANSATYQLTLEGVSLAPNRADMTSAGPSFYVRINNHTEDPNVAGI
jgi:hypothetical protein